MSGLAAAGLPEAIRRRAREGAKATLPETIGGEHLYGATSAVAHDVLEELRIVPPALMPNRLEKLIDLGREPMYGDVDLSTEIGGLASPAPVYVSALGSTRAAGAGQKLALARQAGRLGIPLVIGENAIPVDGYRQNGSDSDRSVAKLLEAYLGELQEDGGGIIVQQSTEDADAEVWNWLYSDPLAAALVESGRLGFELKLGQGAKPGIGGMTLLDAESAARLGDRYTIEELQGSDSTHYLRMATPGTFTEEILRRQIQLMRNNYPRCRVWVKLPPARDVTLAATIAWEAGADAVTVDGAEAGTGLAPLAFLDHVGLPLGECMLRIRPEGECLCVSGRVWDGARALKCLALGARAVGLGRAAVLAVDEDPEAGLCKLVEAMEFELRLLISALDKYSVSELSRADLWDPRQASAFDADRSDSGVTA